MIKCTIMKTAFLKRAMFTASLLALFGVGSCKDNDVREGEMVGPDGIEAEPAGTTATDTITSAEEDSLIEAPSP